jgi:signal transduction histidine kinase
MKVSQGKLVDVWGKPQTNIGSNVRQAFVDEPDAFWMATPAGIAHMDHGVTRWLKSETGALPCDSIFGLQSDLEGGLWAYASCGIFFLSHATLEAWLRDPSAEVSARLLDAYDGANPAASMFTARSARTADGRIWFANGGVVQMVDPSHAFTSPRPPSTPHIEAATADHVALNTVSRIEVPARTRDLDVEYSAPALRAPQRTAYRYKLDDYDRAWHAVDARRHAIYTGVAPGHYVLHVASSNNGEDWSLPASVDVNIAYAFYETTAFRAAAGLAVLLAVAFAYRWRTRQLAVQASSRFEAAIRERERIARELHDTLLQSNQGLLLQVEGAARRMPADDPSREQLETALTHARAAIIEGRARVSAMRTHADIDAKIETLLSRVCQELKSHFRIDCHVELEGTARDVNPAVADEIYWIVREAAINACRHAQARRVDVGVDYSGRDLSVHVRDDGIGIGDDVHSKSGHFGIAGMHERARMIGARVTIARAIKGTHVSLVVPAAIAWAKSSVLGRSSKPPTT